MLDGDLGSSTRGQVFENAHPERYLQMGIAEQNMLAVAAGLATMGRIPFISTFAGFALIRPLDQIRVLIAQTGAKPRHPGVPPPAPVGTYRHPLGERLDTKWIYFNPPPGHREVANRPVAAPTGEST